MTEADMRYIENRRDGWGEWGGAPGPGTRGSREGGAPAGETPGAEPAPAPVSGARMPGGETPRTEPDRAAEPLPYDGTRADALGLAGAADSAGVPAATTPADVEPLDLDTHPAVDVPADLGPAMDAVAGVGRSGRPGGEVPAGLGPVLNVVAGVGRPGGSGGEAPAELGPVLGAVPAVGAQAGGEPSVEEPGGLFSAGDALPDRHQAPGAGPEAPVPGEAAEVEADPGADPAVRVEPPEAVDMVPAQALGTGPDVPAPAHAADRRATDGETAAGQPARTERARTAATVGAGDPAPRWGAGRRRPMAAGGGTAPLPAHLLLRDGPGFGGGRAVPPPDATATRPGARRPPLPRSPQTQKPTRPAPVTDPRLTERPGPVLPGWAALLAGAAGTAAGAAVLGWHGALPAAVTGRLGIGVRPYHGLGVGTWAVLALLLTVVLLALGGLGRGRAGYASVLTLFGDYRGSVRRTGLVWASPLLLRRPVDVRLRHWRSEPLPAVDASGTPLRAVVLVVWRVQDTARAMLGVADHEQYLRDQVEAALARVLSQLPADAFHEETRTLRDAEAVGTALTRMLKGDCSPVGIEVYAAQPTAIEYAPEVAAAMHRRRVAAIDARHRDSVLTAVVDAVDDTVGRLTARGIVELDDYEHKSLVRDLTVAFYAGRSGGPGA
ncbi:SPFH domain-containing protein [Streptomyces sp. NPDC020403]|uniref:SPFH domain-containing protein n=1 Tax=unclassified Streptomyces TaxID=2593676 RepID=UPI0033C1A951